jgi:hypothetical protein
VLAADETVVGVRAPLLRERQQVMVIDLRLSLRPGGGGGARESKPDPEQQKWQGLQAKLHPSLLAVVERLKKNAAPAADEAKFIRDGKAEVQIWLTEKSPEVLARLRQLGFELVLDPQSAKLVIGRLPVEKLAALAEVKAVRFVAPQTK